MKTKNQFLLIAISVLLLAAAGCSRNERSTGSAKSSNPVQVGVAIRKDVPIQIQAEGHVAPVASVAIKSRVDGELERALFNEGDEVRRGETLFVIDHRQCDASLRQAEANLTRDEALAISAEAAAQRNEVLFRDGIGAAGLVEQTRAAADAAQAVVAADKVAVENAQLELSFCRIASPIDGRIGKSLVDAGNTVSKNETLLAVVNQHRPVYVDFLVPEEQLPAIQQEMANGRLNVHAAIPGKPGEASLGKLVFIDNTADTATAMIPLRARFSNEREALWPGETVGVTLTLLTLTNAIVVPSSAVQAGLNGSYVLVVRSDLVVERRPILVYDRAAGETIIKSGIEAGESLVTSGQDRIAPGKRIKIHPKAGHSLANSQ